MNNYEYDVVMRAVKVLSEVLESNNIEYQKIKIKFGHKSWFVKEFTPAWSIIHSTEKEENHENS